MIKINVEVLIYDVFIHLEIVIFTNNNRILALSYNK